MPVGNVGLEIIPRHAWAQGLEPVGAMQPETVQFLLVHHTAGATLYDEDFVPGHLRQIYAFHTGPEKGWPDVCYNFFVDRFGRVWEGRAGSLAGSVMADATGGSQGFAQLVCLLGDFTSVMPTPEAIDALQRTLAWLADREAIDTAPEAITSFVSRGSNRWAAGVTVTTPTIAGHRDMSSTACPGDTFYPYVHDQLQAAVHALRGGPTAPSTVPASPSGIAPTTPTTSPNSTVPPSTPVVATEAPTTSAEPTSTVPPSEATTSSVLDTSEVPTTSEATSGPTAGTSTSTPAAGSSGSNATSRLELGALALGGGALVAASGWALRRRVGGSGDAGGVGGAETAGAPGGPTS